MTQRPIEYRAWDGKRMWYQVQNAYDYFGVVQYEDHDPYDSSIEFGSFQQVLNSAKSVMQFTELYDKNKKKIWEGDVVVRNEDGFQELITDVRWNSPRFTGVDNPHTLEVIGNVYENPEFIQSLKK